MFLFGIVVLIRRQKLKKLSSEKFQGVDKEKFQQWKNARLKAINVFLIFLLVGLIGTRFDSLTIETIVIWIAGLIYAATLSAKANNIKKDLGITWPPKGFRVK